MLRRLFRSRNRLTHPNPRVRQAAVLALDEHALAAKRPVLQRLLRDDPDAQVRLACIARINEPALLETIVNDPEVGEAAAQRLESLRGATGAATATAGHDHLLSLPPEQALAEVQALDDADALIDLALKARGELRDAVLEHPLLTRHAALTALEKRSRHKDKSLNRHARLLLDRLRTLHHEADEMRRRAEELSGALTRTAPALRDEVERERQRALHRRLTEALDEYQRLRGELVGFGESLPDLEALRPAAEPPADPEPPSTAAVAEGEAADEPAPELAESPTADPPVSDEAPDAPAGDPFEALVEEFQTLDAAMAAGEPFDDVAARRQRLTEQWLTLADQRPPEDAQHAVFEAVSHRFRELADAVQRLQDASLPELPDTPLPLSGDGPQPALWQQVEQHRQALKKLDKALRAIRWPDWAPATPALATLQSAAQRLRQELATTDDLLQQELERLDSVVAELTEAVDGGHPQTAQQLLAQARALQEALPPSATRESGRRIGRQAARLAELRDWQTFVTTPKRESLVEAMEALAESPLTPQDQSQRIKELRREWQSLGPVSRTDGRLADRFNHAADRAFEPCRQFFAEQAEQRRHNLAERTRICDQLERYLADTDWSNADMKAAETIMRAARDEWRTFHPVDRNPGKVLQERFEALQERLHDLVKAEWERNLQAKEALLAEAEALAEADLPIRDKVATAKTLQQRWRGVGITPRRPDQRLWHLFRQACDRVFAERDQARQQADAAVQAVEQEVDAELGEFEAKLADLQPQQASPRELDGFLARTAGVDRLPPNRRRAAAARRSELAARYREVLAARGRLEQRERLEALCRWDEAAAAAEREGGTELPTPPPGLEEAAEQRRGASGEPPIEALRRLTVRAELMAGADSPGEDEALRLELQVERLQAGLSGGEREEDALSLAREWCRLGPKDERAGPLRGRFFDALRNLE